MPDVEIYTADFCGFCTAAKRLLDSRGIPYRETKLEMDAAGRDELVRRTGRWSFPQVIVAGQPIGGFQELARIVAAGGLAADQAA